MKLSRLEKRFLAVVLALVLVLGFMPALGQVEAAGSKQVAVAMDAGDGQSEEITKTTFKDSAVHTYGDFDYRIDMDRNVVITGYTGTDTKVTIPAEIDDRPVVSVYAAFKGNETVTEVVLPKSVVKIEYGAFYYATSLKNVNLEHVRYFGTGYWGRYDGLNYAGCQALEDVVLPDGMIVAGEQFANTKMKSLTIPKTMKAAGDSDSVYFGSFEAGALKFANGIKSLAMNFSGAKVPEIRIPDSVTDMSGTSFSGVDTSKITIGSGVTVVNDGLFRYVDDIEIKLGSNVKTIQSGSFSGASIKSLVIPDSVTEIQYRAFAYTDYLTNVTFSKNLKHFIGGYDGFMYTSKWYDVQKNGAVYTGNALYAFKGSAAKNTKINVKSGTTCIGYRALQTADGSGSNITEVTLPNGLKSIGGVSFFNTGIKEIQIPETVTDIDDGAFGNTGLKSVYIPKSVKNIGDYAFGYENKDITGSGDIWVYEKHFTHDGVNVLKSLGITEFFGTCGSTGADKWDCREYAPSKVSGFTIIGYTGTAAEKYAKANGFKFVNAEGMSDPGHTYDKPSWTWTGTSKAVAKFTCKNCGHTKSVTAKITSKVTTAATVSKAGTRTYTAKVTVNKVDYTDKKTGKVYLFNQSKSGLQKYKSVFYYTKKGLMVSSFTGFAKSGNKWYYIVKGKQVVKKTGVVKGKVNGKNGSWFVQKGVVLTTKTGLMKAGKVWYYIQKGKMVTAKKIVKGKVNGKSGSWYCKGGKVQTSFSGNVTVGGKNYNIKKGKVV